MSLGPAPVMPDRPGKPRIGVIDIGSNSIRLVVFDASKRTAVPLFNEKVICGLGRTLHSSGRLDPAGVEQALRTLARFRGIAGAIGVEALDVLATAAVREAADGAAFVGEVAARLGLEVNVIPGREEAELSALGVLCGIPGAEGVMGDLGGGSLELVAIGEGRIGEGATLPLGSLRLMEGSGGDPGIAQGMIDDHLARQAWLDGMKGRRLYLVGGAWRSIARIHISQTGYPLSVVHQYVLPWREAADLTRLIGRLSEKSLEKITGISHGRVATLPFAALVLKRLMRRIEPPEVVFSAHGLREGWFMRRLEPGVRDQDPLLSNCREVAERFSRYGGDDGTLARWTAAIFAEEDAAGERLRRAACLLSDIAWSEHPDYRAEQAYLRILRLGIAGIDHRERAFLALAAFVRYGGDPADPTARPSRALLEDGAFRRAVAIGRALRLAYKLSAGSLALLGRTRLVLDATRVTLLRPAGDPVFEHHSIAPRLALLAEALGREPAVGDFTPVAAAATG
ncbi:MAG: Ppx/GppA family phosphatase [Proteobacteria bacterium]|nr:Ppx/GppA family phosphatase [Pseudomonadota bacterium]